MRTALNDELLSALNSYLAARKSGSSIKEPLTKIISAMDGQPPSSISEADTVIASAANLWRWQRRSTWWSPSFLGQMDDQNLLANNPDLAFLFIFHRDGFLRQAALDRISGPIPNAFLVAALVWRLNDWVEQVRSSALSCASKCLPETDARALADFFLETVSHRTTWGRWSDNERNVLHEVISREDVKDQIVRRLLTGEQGPLPSFLALLLQYEWIDRHLQTIAATAKVPGLRAIALRSLISGCAKYTDGTVWRWINKPMGLRRREPKIVERPFGMESDPLAWIQAGLVDKSAVVRRVALSGVIEHGLYDVLSDATIRRCLQDPSASVRSRAEFILKRRAAGI